MRLRIVGDGTFTGTRVETLAGHKVEMVTGIEFKLDRETRLAEAVIHLTQMPVDIDVEAELREEIDGPSETRTIH